MDTRIPAQGQPSHAERAVLGHRSGPLLVLGGPGTGKTSLMVALVAAHVREGLDPARVLLLAPSRRSALELRDRVAASVGRTIREPLARTAHSYAFGLIRRDAVSRQDATPRLLSAAEQELVIAELLSHSLEPWPPEIAPALRTRQFAGQLRDLMLRAVERDLGPDDLAELGALHSRPLWSAASAFSQEYAQVTALAHPSAYDPAELVRTAVDLLRADPDLRDAERRDRTLVVVDDIDEADVALLDLLEVLAGGGSTLVATADPDSTVYGFRGADSQAVSQFSTRFATMDGRPARQVVLPTTYRLAGRLRAHAARVAERLGGSGAWRSYGTATRPDDDGHAMAPAGAVESAVLASTADEMAHVAARLRSRHLHDGVAWSSMAVVVRSASDLSATRRMLARNGVPVVQRTDEVSLWQHAPVRALLDLLTISADSDAATPELVVDLLLGPLGRLDPARLGGLRRALLVAEGRDGRRQRPDEVIRDAVVGTGDTPLAVSDPAVASLRAVVEHGRAAAVDGSVEQALWALWSSCGVASQWRAAALSGTGDAAAADRDLDAVVALFEAAAHFTDRLPGAGPAAFLDHVRAQQLPGGSWATNSPLSDAVSVLTAHATKGREWNTVAVCRVQEDLWPDLRRRQSLLGTDDLVTVLDSGRLPSPAEQSSRLLAAERRLFHLAVTRASEVVLVTAVDDGDVRPSRLLDELDPENGEHLVRAAADPISLSALVAELRAAVCDEAVPGADRAEAARLLAVLAEADVAGAHPDHWFGLAPLSDEGPVFAGDEPVTLSPSQIEGYLRCPLRWLLQRAGGDNGTALRQSIGNLVHDLAFEAVRHGWSAEQVWARYDEFWAGIDAGRGWVARRERARVDAMVTRLVEWLARNRGGCAGVEIEVVAEVGGATVKGRLDRLQHEGDGLLVVDFKTGTTAPSKVDVAQNPQLGVYQWAVGAGAVGVGADGSGGAHQPRPAGGVLVHLGIPNTDAAKELRQPALGDTDDPQWPARLVRQVAEGVAQPTFPALVNAGCGHCPVRSSCPAHADGGRVVP